MTRVYLVRHGEAQGNVEAKFQGHWNAPLTEKGYEQLEKVKQRFKDIHIDVAYTSDLDRARITTEYCVGDKGIPIHEDPRFRELNNGEWEGMTVKYAREHFTEMFCKFKFRQDLFVFPGGEGFVNGGLRLKDAIEDVVRQNPGKTIFIGSHGGAIKGCLSHMLGIPLCMPENIAVVSNTAVTVIEYEKDMSYRIVTVNDTSHLSDDMVTKF